MKKIHWWPPPVFGKHDIRPKTNRAAVAKRTHDFDRRTTHVDSVCKNETKCAAEIEVAKEMDRKLVPAPALAGIPESTKLDSELKEKREREREGEKIYKQSSLLFSSTTSSPL